MNFQHNSYNRTD